MTEFDVVWAALDATTRSWLIDHNGETLLESVVRQLIGAAGGDADLEWIDRTGEDGPVLTDAAVDRIEALGNGE